MLDSTDVYVLLKIVAMHGKGAWVQSGLANEIGVSPSVVNRALKRAEDLKLYQSSRKRVNVRPLEDALVHGARYFLAPKKGGEVRGTPTAWAAPPLADEIASSEALPPVWPDQIGEVRGLSVEPLHPSAPRAAKRDPDFYALLALVDALRLGGPRETALAKKELHRRLEIQGGS
jgi:DNA-binding Lrp family transcriptional regulator